MHPENGNGAGPEEPVSADETESAGLRPVAPAEADDGSEISDTDIVFDCPYCGHNLVIDYRGAGLQIQCAQCGQAVSVPIPEDMQIDDVNVEPGEVVKQLFKTRRLLRDAENKIVRLEDELEAAAQREADLTLAANSVAPVRLELTELARSMASAAARMAELLSPDGGARQEA